MNKMLSNLTTHDTIATQAIEQLKAVLPVKDLRIKREIKLPTFKHSWDGELIIETAPKKLRFLYEVKKHVQPHTVNQLLVRALETKHLKSHRLLLLADYINPLIARKLKDKKVNFIDTAGNLFLDSQNLYLYVEGKRRNLLSAMKPTRLWGNTGLRVLYALLIAPESVNQPYRHLASSSDVSLGAISWVIRDLKAGGYLEPIAKGQYKLIRRKELMDRWVEEYGAKLRPRLLINAYRDFAHQDVLSAFRGYALVHGIQWALTGGFGADEVVHHYHGPFLTVFVSEWKEESVRKDLNWGPVEGGPITVLKAFSPEVFKQWPSKSNYPVAHPLLLYAELVYVGGERDLETARIIHSQYLEPLIGKA